jgi:hypothetical protein
LDKYNKYDYSKTRFSRNGTRTSALAFGGRTGLTTYVAATEEFTSSINVTTAAAWASGGNMATARENLGGAGFKLQD